MLSAYFGVGIAGIPSGIIGLISGILVGAVVYRVRKVLSEDKAVTIGLLASLTIALLVFFGLIFVTDTSLLDLLIPFLVLGTVYVLGACAVSVLIYRMYFRIESVQV